MTEVENKFIKFCRAKETLILYGAGKFGKIVEAFLREKEIPVFCFCVTQIDEKEEFCGYPIKEIAEIRRDFKDAGIVIAVSEKFSEDVLEQVKGLPYFYDPFLLQAIEQNQLQKMVKEKTKSVKVENQVLCQAGDVSFKKDIVYFLCPGSIGDTLYVASLVKAYKKKQGISTVVLLIKKNQESIAGLFPSVDGSIVSDELVDILDIYFREQKVWELENYRYGFARVGLDGHTYMRTYVEKNLLSGYKIAIMGLEEDAEIEEMRIDKGNVFTDMFNQKTIILMPHESSAKRLPLSFWEDLCMELSENYILYTNTKDETERPIKGTQAVSRSLKDMTGISERCFAVISIRTGICDLLAFTKTNLIVLNTEQILAENWDLKKVFSRDNITNINCYNDWNPGKLKKEILQQLQIFSQKSE